MSAARHGGVGRAAARKPEQRRSYRGSSAQSPRLADVSVVARKGRTSAPRRSNRTTARRCILSARVDGSNDGREASTAALRVRQCRLWPEPGLARRVGLL